MPTSFNNSLLCPVSIRILSFLIVKFNYTQVFDTLFPNYSTALRITRQAKLASMDGGASSSSPLFLGKKDKDFQFSDLPIKAQFVPCSARGKGEEASSIAEVDTVKSWITNLP